MKEKFLIKWYKTFLVLRSVLYHTFFRDKWNTPHSNTLYTPAEAISVIERNFPEQ